MVIILSNVASVELSIDASTVMATQDYVDDKIAEHEQSRRHPDATLTEKGFTQLSSATNSTSEKLAATPKRSRLRMTTQIHVWRKIRTVQISRINQLFWTMLALPA